VKTIATTYNGVRYRSRLEARWAIFFDQLGVTHAYEYEGFDLHTGYYLPDFWLPDMKAWLEIKPYLPPQSEIDKYRALAEDANQRVYLSYRGFENYGIDDEIRAFWLHVTDSSYGVAEDDYYAFCECGKCRRIGIQYQGRHERICGNQCYPKTDKGYPSDRIQKAHNTARSWRAW